jgi:hypothetical protein
MRTFEELVKYSMNSIFPNTGNKYIYWTGKKLKLKENCPDGYYKLGSYIMGETNDIKEAYFSARVKFNGRKRVLNKLTDKELYNLYIEIGSAYNTDDHMSGAITLILYGLKTSYGKGDEFCKVVRK